MKAIKLILLGISLIALLLVGLYFGAKFKLQLAARNTGYQVGKVVRNDGSWAKEYSVFLPSDKVSLENIKSVAADLVFKEEPDITMVSVCLYNDKDIATNNPLIPAAKATVDKEELTKVLGYLIACYDSVDWKVNVAGARYQHLVGVALK